MLTQRAEAIARFTRNDAVRFAIAAGILIAVLTAILGSEILPQPTLTAAVGDLAPRDIVSPTQARLPERQPDRGRARCGRQERGARLRLHDREGRRARQRAAGRVRAARRAGRHRVLGGDHPGPAHGPAPGGRPRPDRCRPGDPARAGRRALVGRPHRVRADPRRAAARPAARQRRAGDPDPAGRAHGRRPRRQGAGARRAADRPARRGQLLVQPGADRPGEGQGAGRGPAGHGLDPPGREDRVLRRADHDRCHGEDQRPRAQDLEAGRRELLRLVPDGRPDRRPAARLAVAVPPDALAPRQRPGPDRAPRGRRDARPQDHGRTVDPAVLPADRGHRHAARDPARRLARDRRHRPHRGHRRRRQRRLARDDDLRPPRRPGRHRHDPQGRPAPGLRPGGVRGLRGHAPWS